MFRKLAKVMVIFVVMLIFNFVGHGIAQEYELLVWGSGDVAYGVFYKEIMREFEAKNPHIKIRYEEVMGGLEISQELEKLRLAIEYEAGPDVVFSQANGQSLREIVKTGNLVDLDDAYRKYGWDERIYKSAQVWISVDGKKWGVPPSVDVVGYYYNKTVFEELGLSIPDTIDEFMSLLETLTNSGYYGTAMGLRAGWPSALMASEYIYISAGTEYIEVMEGKKKWVDSEKVLEGLKVFRSLVDNGYTNPFPTGIDMNQQRDLFFTGKAATLLSGAWLIKMIQMAKPEFEIGFFGLPPINPDTDIKVLGGIGGSLLVSKQRPELQEASFQLVDFIISPEVAAKKAVQLGEITPIDFPLSEETPLLTRETAQAISRYGKATGHWPIGYLPAPLFRKMNSFIQGLMAKEITPFDVLEKMDAATEDHEKLEQE